ncbi:acetylornithine/N-succinyldiaminopimelate aminotransferase [Pseudoxanthobacter soli DSM 19599]|uniref:Acetylornithine aminotransferase n=1 Tax=Pseudoxanthobacter soli DSM 19599 TaxID=1123029 RepID=A0A1M7ZJW7_9HYPH|nr:aspartate aminotransferase family protein [Pseudoxanthobacter soli]SHO65178.1 acetylornithine/N-succinyldiaminopimelate aminotransferase [Pseudoxanthobacter soli DSM 19599]
MVSSNSVPPGSSSLYPTFARVDLSFESGEGAWLNGSDGRRYLDFGSGIAVTSLGHAHPRLVAALQEQAARVWHVSNIYRIPQQEALAERLTAESFADRVFFTNSGAEAVEAAIKTARRYHYVNGAPERFRIITFEGAFHGRTLATIAAGGQAKYLEGFGPKVDGFDQVPFGDLTAAEDAIGPETAAILIEPIQGEGGVRPVPHAELRALRALCDRHGLLLIFDEVQTGVGRTGELFAHSWSGITPDIMAIAKGIGGGFPLGACLATEEAAKGMTPGVHGTTFGGNPLACAVGLAVLDVMLEPGFLDEVNRISLVFKQKLAGLVDDHPQVFDLVRGEGLLIGLRCNVAAAKVVGAMRAEGLLGVGAGDNTVRLLPPLTAREPEIEEAMARLEAAAARIEAELDEAELSAAEAAVAKAVAAEAPAEQKS